MAKVLTTTEPAGISPQLLTTGQGPLQILVVESGSLVVPVDRMAQGAPRDLTSIAPTSFVFLQPWNLLDETGALDVTVQSLLVATNASGSPENLQVSISVTKNVPEVFLTPVWTVNFDVAAGATVQVAVYPRFVREVPALVGSATPPRVRWTWDNPLANITISVQASEIDFSRLPAGSVTPF